MRISDWSSDVCSSDLCHACLLGQDTVGRQPVTRLVAPLTDQLLDSRCKPLVKRSGHVRQLDLLNGGGAQWYSQYNMRYCTTSHKMPLLPRIKWTDRPSRMHGHATESEHNQYGSQPCRQREC